MLSGVSPCAICQLMSPLFRSIAVMRPYGGLINGRPCTDSAAAATAACRAAPAGAWPRPPAGAPADRAPLPAAGRRGASRAGPALSVCVCTGGAFARATPSTVAEVRLGRIRLHQAERRRRRHREDVQLVRFRIERAALPVRAAGDRRQDQRAERSLDLAHHWRREDRADLVARQQLQRLPRAAPA